MFRKDMHECKTNELSSVSAGWIRDRFLRLIRRQLDAKGRYCGTYAIP